MAEVPYEQVHAERFRISEEWLAPFKDKASSVLEVGAPDGFTARIKSMFRLVDNTDFDLRNAKAWNYDPVYDLIVCMEVLEHINDPIYARSPMEDIASFRATGAMNALKGMFSAAKSGGKLFLTTPNGCSAECVRRAFWGYTPIAWHLHVREYGWQNLITMVKEAGWVVERFETIDCYLKFLSQPEMEQVIRIRNLLAPTNAHTKSTSFILASKP